MATNSGEMASYCLDVETFINAVKTHPAIWDVNCDDRKYYNRKQKAWADIANMFINDFSTMSETDKSDIYQKLQGKWRNIRDSYVRHLKKTYHNGKSGYRYARHLTFLNSVYKKSSQTDSDGEEDKSGDWSDEEQKKQDSKKSRLVLKLNDSDTWQSDNEETLSAIANSKRRRFSKHETAAVEFVETPFTEQACSYPTEDEDRSFFESLLPAVREFDMDQKLEFRSEVISLIKNIRCNKNVKRQFKLDPCTGDLED